MSTNANEYFKGYLNGKRDQPTPLADAESGGRKTALPENEPEKKDPSDAQVFRKRDADKNGDVTFEEYIGVGHTRRVFCAKTMIRAIPKEMLSGKSPSDCQ